MNCIWDVFHLHSEDLLYNKYVEKINLFAETREERLELLYALYYVVYYISDYTNVYDTFKIIEDREERQRILEEFLQRKNEKKQVTLKI